MIASPIPEQVAQDQPGSTQTDKRYVFITTQFEGFHCWPDAPNEVGFLRDIHRHIFHVKAWAQVDHGDRQIEFILLKRKIDQYIASIVKPISWSCEHWAEHLLQQFGLASCEVSEDGENGAIVIADHPK